MSEELEMEMDMELDIITLVDDEGVEHEFEILDALETDDGVYYALLPIAEPEDAIEEDTYYIFQVVEQDGEEMLAEVTDEELLDELAALFEARFDELFPAEDA